MKKEMFEKFLIRVQAVEILLISLTKDIEKAIEESKEDGNKS